VVFILFGLLVWLLDRNFRPTLVAIAQARARVLATQAINSAVTTKIASEIHYDTLVDVHTDFSGRPAYAQVNTMEVNRVVTLVTNSVEEQLKALGGQKIMVPLGQAFKSDLLANMGPRIPFTLSPVGSVTVSLDDKIETVGINQSKDLIFVKVTAQVQIVMPFVTQPVSVDTMVPIANVTFLGEVPQTFMNLQWPQTGMGNVPVPPGK
jgi:sporulation protein YunB